jgi:hypothetical protein
MDTKKIQLNIRGTVRLLSEASIMSHSWLLSTILRSEVPCDKVNDAFYLDLHSESFWLVYDILQGSVVVEELILEDKSWNLLKVTADFLLCPEISAHCEQHLNVVMEKYNSMEKEIIRLKESTSRLETENQNYVAMIQRLTDYDMRVLRCDAHRTYRPRNRCGSSILMIGHPCKCDEDEKKVESIRIRNAEHVVNALTSVPSFNS